MVWFWFFAHKYKAPRKRPPGCHPGKAEKFLGGCNKYPGGCYLEGFTRFPLPSSLFFLIFPHNAPDGSLLYKSLFKKDLCARSLGPKGRFYLGWLNPEKFWSVEKIWGRKRTKKKLYNGFEVRRNGWTPLGHLLKRNCPSKKKAEMRWKGRPAPWFPPKMYSSPKYKRLHPKKIKPVTK